MKLQCLLLPALAGIATASPEQQLQDAEAYILRQSKTTTSNPPSIPNELARAVILQRLSTPDRPAALGHLSQSILQGDSLSYVSQFGKPTRPLFEEVDDANEPNQLVIAFSGVTAENQKKLRAAIPNVSLTFTSPGLSRLPIGRKKPSCTFEQSINPSNSKCWQGKTQYLEYDAVKDSNVIAQLGRNLESLDTQALSGKLETTILFFGSPAAESDELRRREIELEDLQQEQVMAEDETKDVPTADSSFNPALDVSDKPFHAFASSSSPKPILPSCFTSHNACVSATDSCSGHGQCVDKWAKINNDKSCFYCYCMATNETDASGHTGVYHWGGSACHKRDVSTPFWLFAGVTIALVATIAFSIGLLFSVGEEKLPGVIGAGVSRSK
ncbi:hypothetical protein GGR54DRAFT_601337 [Hypoxylon sp. NC1633]|nr:hypothetical protein GGR54DRAFT_601337 [Hypoxylon sp. NC1633]